MFDVWFDGARVEPDVMRRLETKLQEAFNLPPAQASILVNGKSHRIARDCSPRLSNWQRSSRPGEQKLVSKRLTRPQSHTLHRQLQASPPPLSRLPRLERPYPHNPETRPHHRLQQIIYN